MTKKGKKEELEVTKDIEVNTPIDVEEITLCKVCFKFPMTEDECKELVNNPKGQIARNLKKYLTSTLTLAARKFLEQDDKECS